MGKIFETRYRFIAAFLIAMAVTHGIEFWHERAQILSGYGDFSALYTSGLMVARGDGKLLYDRAEQWKLQQEFASDVTIRQGPMPFIRPPFEALLFLPLAYLPYPAALGIWSIVKIVLLWFTVKILRRNQPRDHSFDRAYPPWLEVGLCLGFFPAFLDLFQGQDAILLLFILTAALNRLRSGADVIAGLILALGLFKFHLVLPIVIMLWLAGKSRVLWGFLPGAAALVAISCCISGWGVLFSYPRYLLGMNGATGVGVVTAQSMPNLRGLLTAIIGKAPYPGPIHWLLLPIAVVAIVSTGRLWNRRIAAGDSGLVLGYCLALLVAIVTSYYAYSYDMTLLVIPLLLLGGKFLAQSALPHFTRRMIAGGLLLLICTPLYWVLILRCDCPYLLIVPMLILAVGIISAMRERNAAAA